ncbi:hypothetical protein Zmor_009447 [Zophobas morio]|uniref:Uncharacterized protein n=1 Tax=Zophobas morio TaxID=2755281 RepID=A0AA38IIZ8_9CUCU|nr:hypothetical protein Zmor_009447 [Zophobas morio]
MSVRESGAVGGMQLDSASPRIFIALMGQLIWGDGAESRGPHALGRRPALALWLAKGMPFSLMAILCISRLFRYSCYFPSATFKILQLLAQI